MIIFSILAGALWRRILGGWLGLRRSFIVPCSALALIPCFIADWRYALIAWAVSMLYFCGKGHEWSKGFIPLFTRYALPVAIVAFILYLFGYIWFLPMYLTGLLIAITYNNCAKDSEDCIFIDKFIDGKIAIAEFIVGALWFGSLNYCFIKEFG